MARVNDKLTDPAIRHATPTEKAYKLADGRGLYLLVLPDGQKYWRMKYRFAGKEKLLAVGVYPDKSLKDARLDVKTARECLDNGLDPGDVKRQGKLARAVSAGNCFDAVANEWFNREAPHWSATYKARNLGLIKNNLGRWLAARPIGEITAPELLAVLRKTESKGTIETAKRALQVSGQIFRYAVVTGRAERDPSQDLKGALATPKVKHFAAITDPAELGKLLLAMDGYTGTPEVKGALQLSALLFQRPGEIQRMEWAEIDWQQARWDIPAEKMKMRHPHVVPLCRQVLDILKQLHQLTGTGRYVFPSARGGGRPVSENAVRAALRTLGYTNEQQTPHGFRATARTILDEVLGYRVDWIEHQLAHAVKDANGRAYNRTAHLEGRREMMQGWADYLDNLRAVARGENVIPATFNRNTSKGA